MDTVLVVEDEPEVQNYLALALRPHGFRIRFAQDVANVIRTLERHSEICLLLVHLTGRHIDRNLLYWQQIRHRWPNLLLVTFGTHRLSESAHSVLPAPIEDENLLDAILGKLGRRIETADRKTLQAKKRPEIRGANSAETWLQHGERLISQLSDFDIPVLVRGETGVGKEVFARKLHAASKRAKGPFLKLNCAALPSELVESELFGYERGAFTGAVKNTPGKFEMANGGAVLLDEIGDMDFKLQAKLLQVLQDQEFHRLGAKYPVRVDARVMAATHCNLEQAIVEKRFREDLYYRLNIVEVHIPPLRERRSEILVLAQELVQKYYGSEHVAIPADLGRALLDHDWPGNVRELENVMRKFLVFGNADLWIRELRTKSGRTVSEYLGSGPASLIEEAQSAPTVISSGTPPEEVNGYHPGREPITVDFEKAHPTQETERKPVAAEPLEIREMQDGAPARVWGPEPTISILAEVDEARKTAEVHAIIAALNAVLWNRKEAARLLKVDYKALLYKMKKLSIGGKRGNTSESKPPFAA